MAGPTNRSWGTLRCLAGYRPVKTHENASGPVSVRRTRCLLAGGRHRRHATHARQPVGCARSAMHRMCACCDLIDWHGDARARAPAARRSVIQTQQLPRIAGATKKVDAAGRHNLVIGAALLLAPPSGLNDPYAQKALDDTGLTLRPPKCDRPVAVAAYLYGLFPMFHGLRTGRVRHPSADARCSRQECPAAARLCSR